MTKSSKQCEEREKLWPWKETFDSIQNILKKREVRKTIGLYQVEEPYIMSLYQCCVVLLKKKRTFSFSFDTLNSLGGSPSVILNSIRPILKLFNFDSSIFLPNLRTSRLSSNRIFLYTLH
jgi:hypothetical protein